MEKGQESCCASLVYGHLYTVRPPRSCALSSRFSLPANSERSKRCVLFPPVCRRIARSFFDSRSPSRFRPNALSTPVKFGEVERNGLPCDFLALDNVNNTGRLSPMIHNQSSGTSTPSHATEGVVGCLHVYSTAHAHFEIRDVLHGGVQGCLLAKSFHATSAVFG